MDVAAYEVLVFFHIASAMLWVGGGVVVVAIQRRAYRSGGQVAAARAMSELEWADRWIFTPVPLIVVATGATMVLLNEAWAFSQAWIYLTIALIAAEFIFGYRHLGAVESAKAEGDDAPGLGEALRAYLRFAIAALGILVVVVALMVLKPGT